MDINLNYSEDDNPLALKSDFILSFCELAAGGRNGLEPVEKTLIDRSVRAVYRPYMADPRPENMPILEDLYNEIRKQPEPEAQRVAAALELYVHGSLNIFNGRTNVDINNRLVCFDIKEIGKQLKALGIVIAPANGMAARPSKFNIRGLYGAAIGGNQQLPVRFGGITDIVNGSL